MRHSICVIDDSIPAEEFPEFISETEILSRNDLRYLIANANWNDVSVRGLIERLANDADNWSPFAFKTPAFFQNYKSENIVSPEIIIFDWDYNGSTEDSENYLLSLLGSNYSLFFVFTSPDNEDEVQAVIDSPPFQEYRHRLDLVRKADEQSVTTLLDRANEMYDNNFAYRFSKELKMNSVDSMDEILVEMSNLSIADFVRLFGQHTGNERYKISTLDLVSIISERFRSQLLSQDFEKESVSINAPNNPDVARKVWGYRLYHSPTDGVVRKGDIVRKAEEGDDMLLLVLSSDCHMNQFWNKNCGSILVAPLYKLTANNELLKSKFTANKPGKISGFKLTSLVNPYSIEGISVLPGIKDASGTYCDYLLLPKETRSIEIPLPDVEGIDERKFDLVLSYDHWNEVLGAGRLRVSDPFLSPLIQFIMENMTGYGTPDFPKSLQDLIKSSFTGALA